MSPGDLVSIKLYLMSPFEPLDVGVIIRKVEHKNSWEVLFSRKGLRQIVWTDLDLL